MEVALEFKRELERTAMKMRTIFISEREYWFLLILLLILCFGRICIVYQLSDSRFVCLYVHSFVLLLVPTLVVFTHSSAGIYHSLTKKQQRMKKKQSSTGTNKYLDI